MANLHLVTGYSGQPHVSASDQGSFVEAFIRSGEFVLEAGAKFAASIVTNNQIRVNDGEMLMQGRHVKLNPGSYVDLTIENGSQGYRRSDLVVIRYTRNPDSGIEECNLVVLKGTPAESNPADPEYTTGILNAEGALQHDFPLYRVSLSGLVLEGITVLFSPEKSIFDSVLRLIGGTMAGNIAMNGHKVTGLGTPTANGDAVPLKFANEKYAPSGYGLGTVGSICENCNNATKNGFYALSGESCLNAPTAYQFMKYGTMLVLNRYDGLIVQVAIYRNYIAVRYSDDGGKVWAEWGYLNPPLSDGLEYRTIEHYNGAAVYKKVNSNGDILWRKDGESQWHMLASANYVTAATVE